MAKLTRDEIKKACEAVGWRWVETESQGWAESPEKDEEEYFLVTKDIDDPDSDLLPCFDCDAIALLKTWMSRRRGREARIFMDEFGDTHVALLDDGGKWSEDQSEPGLPTAAVRAVNAWAEVREGR